MKWLNADDKLYVYNFLPRWTVICDDAQSRPQMGIADGDYNIHTVLLIPFNAQSLKSIFIHVLYKCKCY